MFSQTISAHENNDSLPLSIVSARLEKIEKNKIIWCKLAAVIKNTSGKPQWIEISGSRQSSEDKNIKIYEISTPKLCKYEYLPEIGWSLLNISGTFSQGKMVEIMPGEMFAVDVLVVGVYSKSAASVESHFMEYHTHGIKIELYGALPINQKPMMLLSQVVKL